MLRKLSVILPALALLLATAPAAFAQTEEPDSGTDAESTAGTPETGVEPAAAPPPAPEATSPTPGNGAPPLTRSDLEAWLDGYMPYALKQGDIAGAVVTVVKDGEVLLSKGFGYADLEKHTLIDPARTLFRPGSISKLFTWTAVMQLVEQGKLDLDADINTYLDFQIPEAFGKPITLRNIMTHTPGFQEKVKSLIVEDPKALMSLEAYVKSGVPARIFPPGTTPAYSNYATALAGYIVSRVSGLAFEDYVERNIFEKLGMSRSTFRQPVPEEFEGNMATGYKKASDGTAQAFELIPASPAGALSTTGDDMGRFMIAHLQDGGPLLSPATAKTMHETADPHIPPLLSMRLGFYQADWNGQRVIAHAGDTQYFHSDLHLFLDRGIGLFVSMNSAGNGGASGRVRGFLYEAFTDRYFPMPVKPVEPLDTAKAHAAEVAGVYDTSRGFRTNFLAMSGLLSQFKLVADKNGDLITPTVKGTDGAPRHWREIKPYVWRDVDGKDRLAVRMENGKPAMLGIEPFSSIIVFQPPGLWRSSALLYPVMIGAVSLLLLTVIGWPVRAIVRWRYGASFPLEGTAAKAYRRIRIASLLMLAWFGGWIAIVTLMLSNLSYLDGSMDTNLRVLQVAAIIPVVAILTGVWNLKVVWTRKSSWFAKLWSLLLLLSIAGLIWFAAAGSLFSFGLNY